MVSTSMLVLMESYRLTRARTSTGMCLHGDNRSHSAGVIKSHGQTWTRPTRLRYCNLTSARELNKQLLAEGKTHDGISASVLAADSAVEMNCFLK